MEEAAFLQAAANLVSIQESLLAEFERSAGVSAYDYWIRRRVGRESASAQSPSHGPWRYRFHGLEVDVTHEDGRHVRLELGPRGMTNVVTGWSIAVHVVGSKSPWPMYGRIRDLLITPNGSPNHERARQIEQALFNQGLLAYADPELMALRQKHTRKSPSGTVIDVPPSLAPETTEDIFLCERLVLTEEGRRQASADEQPVL